jgi:hypothetical protein
MTALDALMPHHALFAQAAIAMKNSSLSPLAPVESDSPTHCKYITVESPAGEILPILFHHKLQHRDAVPEGLRPVSAGFVMILGGHLVIPAIDSTTLNLGPKPNDEQLLNALLNQ